MHLNTGLASRYFSYIAGESLLKTMDVLAIGFYLRSYVPNPPPGLPEPLHSELVGDFEGPGGFLEGFFYLLHVAGVACSPSTLQLRTISS